MQIKSGYPTQGLNPLHQALDTFEWARQAQRDIFIFIFPYVLNGTYVTRVHPLSIHLETTHPFSMHCPYQYNPAIYVC
jgi:hypothetical protein